MSVALTSTAFTRSTANGYDVAAATGSAAADVSGNTFTNTGSTLLRFKNTNAATRTPTVNFASTSIDNVAVTPVGRSYVIPLTTGDRLVGPFPVSIYGSNVLVTYDAVTNLSVTVLEPSS